MGGEGVRDCRYKACCSATVALSHCERAAGLSDSKKDGGDDCAHLVIPHEGNCVLQCREPLVYYALDPLCYFLTILPICVDASSTKIAASHCIKVSAFGGHSSRILLTYGVTQ